MAYHDGFENYEGNAIAWRVYHNNGTTTVHATSEAIALQRFIAKYPNLKVIDSSKGEYKATHIYFRDGNYNFQWELQIWNKCDEATNIESHRKYKQEYVKWEKSNKGGEI